MSRKPEFDRFYIPAGYDPSSGEMIFEGMAWSDEWRQIGQLLWEGRKRLQMSKREAASRAGISEALWRQLEGGGKMVQGRVIKPNPRPENLYGALKAVGEDPEAAFAFLHWDVPEPLPTREYDDRLEAKLSRLLPRDRALIESLIDRMLESYVSAN
jgi:transcriptional regulator with XRE-family HTH domain